VLRAGLLEDRVIVFAGVGGGEVPARCRSLGATVSELSLAELEEADARSGVEAIIGDHGGVDTLVVDAGGLFERLARAEADTMDALRGALDTSWNAVRAVANAAFIPEVAGGKVVLIAPRATDGRADPAREGTRAGLENMARTLSIEWARYQVLLTALLPAPGAGDEDVAELAAFLASPAGDYFSGCRLAPAARAPIRARSSSR